MCQLRPVHMDTAMHIECASHPIHLRRWIGSGLKLNCIIIHDLREITPTMRSLACSLAGLSWPVVLLQRRWGRDLFSDSEKSGIAW